MKDAEPKRGETESDDSDWLGSETATALLWLSNQEAAYLDALRLVSEAGNYFEGADALENWILEDDPLSDSEPNLYTALLAQAIASINWDELAEAFAPDAWAQPQNPESNS
jgi:hypothetical protein